MRTPRPLTITGICVCLAAASRSQTLSPADRASAAFEKVASGAGSGAGAAECVESATAWLAASRGDERYLPLFRRGFCLLSQAVSTNHSQTYAAAAADLTQAVAAWPPRLKDSPPDAVRVLALIARIEAGQAATSYSSARQEFEKAATRVFCAPMPAMTESLCQEIAQTGRLWTAWAALYAGDVDGAAPATAGIASPWTDWIEGAAWRQRGKLGEAADRFERALAGWSRPTQTPGSLRERLGPKPDIGAMHYEAGLARFGARQFDRAIDHFDASLQASVSASQPLKRTSHQLFLRARSKETFGLLQPAATDYALAVQAAKAEDGPVWPVGQARYYRGLILYRLKDFPGAETELTAALSANLGEIPLIDVTAWKALAGVAAGNCGSPAALLETSSQAGSGEFPKGEALTLLFACRMKQASTIEQLLSFHGIWSERLDEAQKQELEVRIAEIYAKQGVDAEDRQDPQAAADAYRKAIRWNPGNVKARFNLGAIYIEEKRFPQAEAEFRSIVVADPADLEASYWLAESILGQQPDTERRAEACSLLRRALEIEDPERKSQFSRALTSARCAPVN